VSVFFTGCKANSLSANIQEKPAVVEHSSCIGIQMRLPWANVGNLLWAWRPVKQIFEWTGKDG